MELGISYLEKEMEIRGSIAHRSKVMKYLAKHYPHILLLVVERFHPHIYKIRFGKKSTKALHSKFMELAEEIPIAMLMERIKVPLIFKRLSHEEQVTFFKLLVQQNKQNLDYATLTDWLQSSSQMTPFMQLIPPGERARMAETVFFELFNEKFLDHPEVWSLEFLEVFPEDYRSRLVEILDKSIEVKAVKDALRSECKDREREPREIYKYLLGFENAFPLLTEMMNQMTTVARREILLKEMVRNCIINKDPDGLESVVRYISTRHKNDDPRIICNLILHSMIPFRNIINSNVWNWMEKMAILLLINLNDSYVYQVVLENYMAFKIRNNLDAQPQVRNMVKLSVVPSVHSFVLVRNMERSYSRALVMLYYKEIFSGDSGYDMVEIKEKLMLSVLMSVNHYNSIMRRNKINMEDLPLLVQGIEEMVRKIEYSEYKHPLSTAILNNTFLMNKYASFLIDISMKPKALRYLIKSHPNYIIENLALITNYVLEFGENRGFYDFFVSRCHIDFLGCMPEIEKVIRERFESTTISSIKLRSLRAYSHIATLEDFMELTRQYVPHDNERFVFDNNRLEFYEVQRKVPGVVKNVKPAWKNLNFVSKYLKRDFLRFVLPSFFVVCYNSSVSSIIPFLKDNFPRKVDVSVKKVILCCILDLLPNAEKFQYCQMLWGDENHTSLKQCVFQTISRSLRDEQSEEIFEMVKKCISEADEKSMSGRLKMKVIPQSFQGDYASALWEFTEKNEGKEVAITCRKEIVNHFNAKNISLMSNELCHKILGKYLFECNAEVGVEDFCCRYILHHPQSMDEKLSFILELLRQRQTRFDQVTYFINRFKGFAKTNPKPVFTVFEVLLKEWRSIYSAPKMFREFLLLNYMKGYSTALKASNKGNESFGAALGGELRKIVNSVSKYERFVGIFNRTLCDFIFHFNFNDDLHLVIDNFLGSSFGTVEGIIAIHQIPANVFDSFKMDADHSDYKNPFVVELREKYKSVIGKLSDKNDDVLKIYMNLRMGNAPVP